MTERLRVEISGDSTDLKAALAAASRDVRAFGGSVEKTQKVVDRRIAEVKRELAQIQTARANPSADLDKAAFDRKARELRAEMARLGALKATIKVDGAKDVEGLKGSIDGAIPTINRGAVQLGLLGGAAVAGAEGISALAGGTVALTSALGPMVGGAVGVPALFGAIGQAAGVVAFAGVKDLTEALGGNEEALKRLTPEGRQFLEQLQEMEPRYRRLQTTAQGPLFDGIGRGLDHAIDNFPILNRIIDDTSHTIGRFFVDAGKLAGRKGFGEDLLGISEQNNRTLDQFGDATLNVVNALRYVLVAGQPFIDWMGRNIEQFSELIEVEARAGEKSGELAEWFDESRQAIHRVVDIGDALIGTLLNIGEAGKPIGESLLVDLRDGAEALEKWTGSVEGKNKLSAYFRESQEDLEAFWAVVEDVLDEGSIEGSITRAITLAIPEIGENAGKLGLALLHGMARGFLEGNALERVFIGAAFIRLVGGSGALRALGVKLAAWIAAPMAATIAAETAAGTAGGAAATKWRGAGAVAGRLFGAGLVGVGAAAVLKFADELKNTIEGHGSASLSEMFEGDLPEVMRSIDSALKFKNKDNLIEIQVLLDGMAQSAVNSGEEIPKSLQRAMDAADEARQKMGKDLGQIIGKFDDFIDGGDKMADRYDKTVDRINGQTTALSKGFGILGVKGPKDLDKVGDSAEKNAGKRVPKSLAAAEKALKIAGGAISDVERSGSRDFFDLRANADRESGRMASAVKGSVKDLVDAVRGGFGTMEQETKRALGALGVKAVDFVTGKGGKKPKGHQRGGVSMVPGSGDGDKVPDLVPPGTGFINKRATQVLLEPGELKVDPEVVQRMGGPQAIHRINSAIPRFQTGGVAAGPQQLGENLSRRFGLTISSGYRPGDDGYHGQGLAVDVAGGVENMNRASAYVNSSGIAKQLLEGIYAGSPNLSVKNGEQVDPGFWGADTWADHHDHLHLALSGKLGPVAQRIARQILQGPDGILKTAGQANLDTVYEAADTYVQENSVTSPDIGAGGMSKGEIAAVWRRANRNQGDPNLMAAIALAESAGVPSAQGHDPGGTTGLGLWQITTGFNDDLIAKYGGQRGMFDPLNNAKAAGDLLARQGLGAWVVYNEGTYQQYLQKGGIAEHFAEGGIAGERLARAAKPPPELPGGGYNPFDGKGGGGRDWGDSIGNPRSLLQKVIGLVDKGKRGELNELMRDISKPRVSVPNDTLAKLMPDFDVTKMLAKLAPAHPDFSALEDRFDDPKDFGYILEQANFDSEAARRASALGTDHPISEVLAKPALRAKFADQWGEREITRILKDFDPSESLSLFGQYGGKSEKEWLDRELQSLFSGRNTTLSEIDRNKSAEGGFKLQAAGIGSLQAKQKADYLKSIEALKAQMGARRKVFLDKIGDVIAKARKELEKRIKEIDEAKELAQDRRSDFRHQINDLEGNTKGAQKRREEIDKDLQKLRDVPAKKRTGAQKKRIDALERERKTLGGRLGDWREQLADTKPRFEALASGGKYMSALATRRGVLSGHLAELYGPKPEEPIVRGSIGEVLAFRDDKLTEYATAMQDISTERGSELQEFASDRSGLASFTSNVLDSRFGANDDELQSILEDIQGYFAPKNRMSSLPDIGVLGGRIFEAQLALRDLGVSTQPPVSPTPDTGGRDDGSELDRLRLEEAMDTIARLRLQSAQGDVFKGMFGAGAPGLPYLGAFLRGTEGVSGRSGAAVAVVHNDEVLTVEPDPKGPFGSQFGPRYSGGDQPQVNVELTFADNSGQLVRLIDARVDGRAASVADKQIGRLQRQISLAPGR